MSLEDAYRRYAGSARKRRAWAAGNPGNIAIRAELLGAVRELAAAPLRGEGGILDVGCGGGWLLERLAAGDADRPREVAEERLHGVDALEPRVEVARRRLPGATIRHADARRLPYPDDEFALLTLLTCLSSLSDREAATETLAEARRVLAPSGLLLVYEPRLPNPLNRATLHVPRRLLRDALGREQASRRLTGFPPLARRLDRFTPRLYPALSRVAATHRLAAWNR